MAAVGRLAASMAHEIRNPLASISGSVQLLLEASQTKEDDRDLMNIVVNEADRLSGLLTGFLHFARPKSPEKENVEVSLLFDQLLLLLKADKRFEHIDLIKNCPENIIMYVDHEQIQQSLWGLAINASEAMAGEGAFRLTVTETDPSTIIIEDSGPGIPDDLKERVFEPFFQPKKKEQDWGWRQFILWLRLMVVVFP